MHIKGRQETLRRLAKHVPGLSIDERDGGTWLSMGGFIAPVIVGHGFVTIRTEYGWRRSWGEPNGRRKQIDVPKRTTSWIDLPKTLAKLIRQSHEGFAAYSAGQAMLADFRSILEGVGRVGHRSNDGTRVVVEFRRELTRAQAVALAACVRGWT